MNLKSFSIGFIMGGVIFSSSLVWSQSRYDILRLYAQVFNLVEENYIEKVDVPRLVQYSIRGLLGSLDSYSGYLPAKEFKKFKKESQGGFVGLGLELSLKNRSLNVVSVMEDAPAWNAGILPKDQITSINDKKIYALDFTEATKSLKGKVGKTVKLKVKRLGVEKPIIFKLKRRKINIKPAKVILNKDGILVVRVTGFTVGSAEEFKDLILKEEFKTLVLDLRNNPGGLLDEAVDLVDLFAEKGTIVKTVSRNKPDELSFAHKAETPFKNKKVFVLVDHSSASASEVVASALRDLKKTKLIGLKTYGKGSVQSVIPLPSNQGGVKLTISRYFTQSGKMIDKKGVMPDYKWEGKGRSSLPRKDTEKDELLQWALEIAKKN